MNEPTRPDLDALVRLLGYLRALLEAGQPLPDGLRSLARIAAPPADSALLAAVASRLEAGGPVGEALASVIVPLPSMVRSLVRAGEKSGDLVGAIDALAGFYGAQLDLERRVHAALLYPKTATMVALGVALPIMARVVAAIRDEIGLMPGLPDGATAPVAHRWLLAMTDTVLWPYTMGPVVWVPLVTLAFLLLFCPVGPLERPARWLSLCLFWLGPVRRHSTAAAFSRGLSILLGAGVPLDSAVELMGEFSSDPRVRSELETAARQTRSGMALSAALAGMTVFPPTLHWLVTLGEQGRRLEDALGRAASFFEREARERAELLSWTVQPLVIACLAMLALPLIGVYGRILGVQRLFMHY